MNKKALSLTIGWLYPDLMSTYGDRGNIIVLQKRSEWRGIDVKVKRLELGFNIDDLQECDLLFMGGAQDTQQTIVAKDLKQKASKLKDMIENGIPGLYICGAYQFLGKYYKEADETIIEGLSIFDLYTENPGLNTKRLIGDIIIKTMNHEPITNNYLVGFENHGGRTYLGKNVEPFAQVIHGFGNNGNQPRLDGGQAGDRTEGVIYKNSIGSYLHGPILPKNPELADYVIQKALEVKYKKNIELLPLDDTLEQKAKEVIVKRYLT